LYASYSGHLNIIKFLIEEHQVNEKILTNSGLNVLHLAAQKNVIAPFLYFRERIGLEEKDSLNSSALHWAAYMNSEDVVAYILS
jgi:ankyrin repeat protein